MNGYTSVLLERILELEKRVHTLRDSRNHYKASREMWKKRAMDRAKQRPKKAS